MKFSIEAADPMKHRKALEVLLDATLSENTSKITVNYKLDAGVYSVKLLQRLRAIASLLKDPEVSVDVTGMEEDGLYRLIEFGEAMQELVDVYYDRECLLRRYGKERDNTVHGGGDG